MTIVHRLVKMSGNGDIVYQQAEFSLFAKRLRLEREKRTLTQQELNRLCGFSANQINRYETGLREPSFGALIRLAEVLEVSLDYMMGLSDDPHGQLIASNLDPHDRQILDAYHKDGWPRLLRLGADRIAK